MSSKKNSWVCCLLEKVGSNIFPPNGQTEQLNLTGWCSTPTLLLICSSFSRENGHSLLICSSLSTAQLRMMFNGRKKKSSQVTQIDSIGHENWSDGRKLQPQKLVTKQKKITTRNVPRHVSISMFNIV